MASLNKVFVIGNLTKDPEQRSFPDGSAVSNITIACNEKYKDKQGEVKEAVEFVNVVFFGKLAEIAGQYLNKGSLVHVEGKMKTEKYTDKNGVDRWSTKVVGNAMQMLSSRSESVSKAPAATNLADIDSDIPF